MLNIDYNNIISDILNILLKFCCKEKNKEKLNNLILSPVLNIIIEKLKPYIILFCTTMISIVLLLIALIIVIFQKIKIN